MTLFGSRSIQFFSLAGIALGLGLTACAPSTQQAPTAANIKGAGATAPYPLYQKWFADFGKANNVQIGYESVGSGAGIKQFLAETVDFGATDSALKADERSKFPTKRGKAIQVPATGLFIVFAYNLEGVANLKLSRAAFCGIVDGSVKTWNDPKIAKDNAGVTLPEVPVTFITRSDGSGTTSIFSKHIKKACPNWALEPAKSVEWGIGIGAKGNEGVTAQIQQTKGSVGYTEYSYAKENKLAMATVQNKAGEFVIPSPESASQAMVGVTVPDDFAVSIPDPEAKGAYPIVSLTWLLFYETYPDQTKVTNIKNFMKWALKDGKAAVVDLGYVPLPDQVSIKALTAVEAIKVGQ
jgi:phosphate transport system substrate-binding protein